MDMCPGPYTYNLLHTHIILVNFILKEERILPCRVSVSNYSTSVHDIINLFLALLVYTHIVGSLFLAYYLVLF